MSLSWNIFLLYFFLLLAQKKEIKKRAGEIDAATELCWTSPLPISPFTTELPRALSVDHNARRRDRFDWTLDAERVSKTNYENVFLRRVYGERIAIINMTTECSPKNSFIRRLDCRGRHKVFKETLHTVVQIALPAHFLPHPFNTH